MTEKTLLILDIDEMLVYSSESNELDLFDFRVGLYKVIKRPYLDDFILSIKLWFDIAIWTSAGEIYAYELCRILFPENYEIKFLWCRDRCSTKLDLWSSDLYWVKNLKKLKRRGYHLSKILMIEDDARTMQQNYGNLITVKPFFGDQDDIELKLLLSYLEWIANRDDVRVLEKRYWRSFVLEKLQVNTEDIDLFQ